jgi:hypothetical protein
MPTMPKCYADLILAIDPSADVERVGNIAHANFRYFSEMTRANWVACVERAQR